MIESPHPLYVFRVARGLSRERLAQRAGVSARTVFGIERGDHEPRRATAFVLAQALGIEPEYLLNEIEPASPGSIKTTPTRNGTVDEHPTSTR
jgi:transcriptional regulator with XRE-family HTH domain